MTMEDNTRFIGRKEAYKVITYYDIDAEQYRRDMCLCWRCVRMVTVEDTLPLIVENEDGDVQRRAEELAAAFNCPIAQRIYEACKDGGAVAAPVTRCPMYLKK